MSEIDDVLSELTLKDQDNYFWSLGRLMHTFANIEVWMQVFLWQCCEAREFSTAQAIFSGTRISTATDMIKRVIDSQGKTIHPMLEDAFKQLSEINRTRDRIVHFGAWPKTDGSTVISTWRSAYAPSKAREWDISPEILDHMTRDLVAIGFRLQYFISTWRNPKRAKYEDYNDFWQHTWLYKPVQRAIQDRNNPDPTQEQ